MHDGGEGAAAERMVRGRIGGVEDEWMEEGRRILSMKLSDFFITICKNRN